MEGLGSIASDAIQWLLTVAASQWWLVLMILGAVLLLGLCAWCSRMKRQTNFPLDIDVSHLLDEKVKALLDDTRDLSEDEQEEIKSQLKQRLAGLRDDLVSKKDRRSRGDLEAKIGEIEAVLAQFEGLMPWMKIHASELNTVIEEEKLRINARRGKAAREFVAALLEKRAREEANQGRKEPEALSGPEERYKAQLERTEEERPPIGLAFSGGGIRSAIFNLGMVQGLARYGFLPWVDYLSSVSGGGLAAACLTTLLLIKGKRTEEVDGEAKTTDYHPFNTQWSRFPFNPVLKVFDVQTPAHGAEPGNEVAPSLEKGSNKQLKYLRDNGNYIIPRMGWVTRDVMRGIGAFLATIAYTLSVFLLVLVAFAAFHYGLTAALTPAIVDNVDLRAMDRPEGEVREAGETEATWFDLLQFIIGDEEKVGESAPVGERPTFRLPSELWQTLGAGFVFSFVVGLLLAILYKKDPTTRYRLRPWKPPRDDVSLGAYLTINRIRVLGLICLVVLSVLTLWLWIGYYPTWSASTTRARHFYWAWGLFYIPLACAAGWFVSKHCRDYKWAKRGLPEQLRIDDLVKYLVAGLFVWVMVLWISQLRLQHLNDSELRVFWISLPAVFILGSMIGLAVFRILPLSHHVHFKKSDKYTKDSIGWLGKTYFRLLNVKEDVAYVPVASGGMDYRLSIWSNLDFRSMFWTLQGMTLYGLAAFVLSALLALPHYFSLGIDGNTEAVVPLGAAIITAAWAAFLSSVTSADVSTPKSLLVRIIALPQGVRRYVLGVLVIALNLSIIFLVQSAIDNRGVAQAAEAGVIGQAYVVGVMALVFLGVIGRCLDFNYLTPHYFARDRIAEVFMKTDVETRAGQVKTARDHRGRELWKIVPEGCSAPYHIVLTALNLPGSWHLAHKDRKSEPFIFSKYYCGSDITGYVKTRKYRGGITKYSRAIALSGAAVSPGLGYHTFFAQAFMTTLLNIRLGLWMVNPQQYTLGVLSKYARPHQRERDVFWPTYLGDEALGRISERRPLVNLTDGEHTGDGIGLYPLLQRRCKVIIAGDASGDPAGHATGLYSVVRQVKADLGIDVDINVDGTRPAVYDTEKKLAEPSQRHFAVGRITYPATFDDEGNQLSAGSKGWLVYFKSAVTKDDPGAILGYWNTHKMDFPIPSTGDQFFDEEQWEYQRWLGELTIRHTLEGLKQYCDESIKAEQANPGGADQDKIDRLEAQRGLAERCLEHDAIDYGLLYDNPDLPEWVLGTLYKISKMSDESSET